MGYTALLGHPVQNIFFALIKNVLDENIFKYH